MNDADQLAARAGSRCQGYWLLSRLFLEPPAPALLGDLRQALATAESDSPGIQEAIVRLRNAVEEALLDPEAAAVGFTRYLVLIPKDSGEAHPIESHFLQGRSPGEATERLLRRMGDWGYGPLLAQSAPPDHLGAELRLMALLCNDEREAWQSGDTELAVVSLRRQAELLYEHLTKWIPSYCRALGTRAEHGYLQAVARITVDTLDAEIALMDEMCAQVDIRSLG